LSASTLLEGEAPLTASPETFLKGFVFKLMPVLTIKLNAVQVLALSALGVAGGIWIKSKLPVLDRLNIPASVVGGLGYALIALVLRDRYLNFDMDLFLRDILMVGFFTTVGLSASVRLLKKGGVQVVWFLVLASIVTVFQNVLGLALAKGLALPSLLGIITGSVALAGGPATALAFGPEFEKMGAAGASSVGIAAAMFGIVAGGLLGGSIGGRLISRHKLKSTARNGGDVENIVCEDDKPGPEPSHISQEAETEHSPLLNNVIAVAISMGIGTLISPWLEQMGRAAGIEAFKLPAYVGSMIAAGVIRNLDDRYRFARISQHEVDNIGNIALSLFIVMALLTLRLWELFNLALPLVGILLAQVVLIWLMCNLVYYLMGRDYEAAVMSGGFCGFMLGTTANSLACMQVLVEKFGPAPRAYIVVPLVGAFFIDFTNAIIITTMANLVR
jgi:ESS family glutamate:Na+ symporter